jgi:hypothetical protein
MNTELGRLVLKQATEFPETFSMDDWVQEKVCGTAACIAGHAMLFSGYSFQRDEHEGYVFIRPDGSQVSEEANEAISLLGLTDEEFCPEGEDGLFYLDDDEALERLRELTGD